MCRGALGEAYTRGGIDPTLRAAGIEPKGYSGKLASGVGNIIPKVEVPTLLASDPVGDQAKIDAESSAKGAQARTSRRRRIRASSLLATGGTGDTADVVTGQPYAKPTLGA